MENNPVAFSVFDEFSPQLVPASRGKRFANYIIDGLVFYIALVLIVLGLVFGDYFSFDIESTRAGSEILSRLLGYVAYALLLGFQEAFLQGRTIGKLITGTRAVNEDGSNVSTKTALLRGFARAVPFCAFSALGGETCYPWQDRWTKTYVIDINKTKEVSPSVFS